MWFLSLSLSLTFLSSWACFLWATVDRAGRGWSASVVMLGLISFCCLLQCFFLGEMLALGAAELKCAAELESLLFMRVRARQRGGDTSHRAGGGGNAFGR